MKMKSTLSLIAIIGLTLISCKKNDHIQPVITLNGSPEQVVQLNSAYVESGATALDNKSGDITDQIVITGNVNVNLKGEYRMYYDVEDENGNKAATATRYVQVVNNADYMIGTYLADPSCSGTGTTYNTTVSSSETTNNEILIRKVLYTVEDDPVVGNVNGATINIPLQTIGFNTIEGSGTLIGDNFLIDIVVNGISGWTCSIDHTKL
jgi:hypothetical protein